MKRCLLLIAALTLSAIAMSQNRATGDPSYYNRLYASLYADYVKNSNDVACNQALAEFFRDPENPMFDLATAMRFSTTAVDNYTAIVVDNSRSSYKKTVALIRKGITIDSVRTTRRLIIAQARQQLKDVNDLKEETLDSYATLFKEQEDIMLLIESQRMTSRYNKALSENTLQAYNSFISHYPFTSESETAERMMSQLAEQAIAKARREEEVDSLLGEFLQVDGVRRLATKKKSALAYKALQSDTSVEACRIFLSKYPGSDEYMMVLDRLEQVLQIHFDALKTPRQYADFAHQYSDNPLADKAIDKLKRLVTETRNPDAVRIYLEEFPLDADHNTIFQKVYSWYAEEGNKAPLDNFDTHFPDFPYQLILANDMEEAQRIDTIDLNYPFVEKEFPQWASKVYYTTGKRISFVALQRTLQQYIEAGQWDKIPERIEFFALSFENSCTEEIAELKSIISAPSNPTLTLSPVVRPAYNMMHPAMHPNGKYLFYNREMEGVTSIYAATNNGNPDALWRGIGKLRFADDANNQLMLYSLFDNGNRMLVGKEGDIYVAFLDDTIWRIEERLPYPVNTPFEDFDAYMLPDGSGILLASDRPGGYNLQQSRANFHGDTALASDLYYVPRTPFGWGNPVNLGINVNSPYMECSPVVSDDLSTIYFITDGRGGLGYGDIYYTTRDNIDDWTSWRAPTNYGKGANSGNNEASMTTSDGGKTLIVSTNTTGRYGCYRVTGAHTINKEMRRVTVEEQQQEMSVTLARFDKEETLCLHRTVAPKTPWHCSLYADGKYILFAKIQGCFTPGVVFSPARSKVVKPKHYDADAFMELAEENKLLWLPAIQFENDKSRLSGNSYEEISNLADFLASNPLVAIEIVVHVSGSDDTFCFNLSQSRAAELKKVLVSKGVEPDRIALTGYGNSKTKKETLPAEVGIAVMR